MLLRNEALDAIGEERRRLLRVGVWTGLRQKQILFVLESFACRAIADPIGLILIKLLQSLYNQNSQPKYGR